MNKLAFSFEQGLTFTQLKKGLPKVRVKTKLNLVKSEPKKRGGKKRDVKFCIKTLERHADPDDNSFLK